MTITTPAKRRLIVELLAVAAGAGLVAAGGWYLMSLKCDTEAFICENSAVREYPSPARDPGQRKKFVLFLRDCGATTRFVTNGSVLDVGEALPDRPGNVFTASGAHGPAVQADASADLIVTWMSGNEVLITFSKGIHLRDRRTVMKGVKVSYAETQQ